MCIIIGKKCISSSAYDATALLQIRAFRTLIFLYVRHAMTFIKNRLSLNTLAINFLQSLDYIRRRILSVFTFNRLPAVNVINAECRQCAPDQGNDTFSLRSLLAERKSGVV